ncbi:MAG: type II CAAX endopeptidase family protein [Candidatus Thorarchaeota archaeon]
MVIEDPDHFELKEASGIDIFVPSEEVEREINWDQLFRILLLTGAGFVIMLGLTLAGTILLMAANLIVVDLITLEITFAPWTFLALTFAEIGFLYPPYWYIKKKGLSLKSIGIKNMKSINDIGLGLLIGVLMLGANLIISFIIFEITGGGAEGDAGLFQTSGPLEVIAWVLVMFFIVGLSEELLFRGFLQRRMDLYLRTRSKNYKTWSLIITSFIFAAIHLDMLGIPTRFVLGLFLGYLAQKKDYSILAPTVAHGFNNAIVVVLVSLGF